MRLNTPIAAVSSVVAAALSVVLLALLGNLWIGLGILAGLVLVGYILAAATLSGSPTTSELVRGFLIGLNAGANGFLIAVLVGLWAPPSAGVVAGAIFGLIAILSVFPPISQSEVYQGIMGWSNWVLPMSWPIVALGLLLFLFNLLLASVTGFQVDYLRLRRGRVDWPTGTFFVKGGLISNLNAWDTAFNMGNFSFVDMNATAWHMQHEAGHTLNLAAFGWLFHLLGAFDEIVLRRHARAYAERLAESNSSGSSAQNVPMWA